jgi:hypothetical protein
MKKLLFLLSFLWCYHSQAQFTIGNGFLTVSGGTEFFAEGVNFLPSARMTLSNNILQQSATPVYLGHSTYSIAKVVSFGSPFEFTGTLHFSYSDADLNGNPEEGLKLSYLLSGAWKSSSAGVVNTSGNFVEESVTAKSFESLTASAYFSTLPVSLLSFTARWQTNATVLLQWHTATETDNSHFTIERSSDAIRFTPVGTVAAATTAARQGDYSFTDAQPLEGTNYYRLRQHDLNGAEHVYGVRMVRAAEALPMARVLPNPVTGNGLMLDMRKAIQQPIAYSVSNAAGQVLLTGLVATQQQWIVTGSLPVGSYLLRLGNGQTVRFQKQ